MSKTIDEVKAWLTNGLLVILGWFVVDMKNDVKVLLDRTARLETKAEFQTKLKGEKTSLLVEFKGMDFIFDRHKKLIKTNFGYEYI
jgi:hypothetical protein